MSLFQKASKVATSLFKKGGSADKGFRKISSGLDKAGGVLSQAGNIGNQIANTANKLTSNPLVDVGIAAFAPELIPALAAAQLGSSVLKKGSQMTKSAGQGLKTASNITDVGSYQGSTLQNLQDAKRRVDATNADTPAFV